MEKNTNQIGTSDMPSPQVMAYDKIYTVSSVFRKDLESVVSELPYAEASRYLNTIDMYEGHIPVAALNEYIRALGNISYKVVAPLMKALSNKETFEKYFILETKSNGTK